MADSHPIKYYLPDEIFLLLASLVYALIQRVMEVNSSECKNSGLVLWLILLGLLVAVAAAKYVATKKFGLALIAGVVMFVMGLGLHRNPLDCVFKPSKDGTDWAHRRGVVDWVPIIQAVFIGIPFALYVLILAVKGRA